MRCLRDGSTRCVFGPRNGGRLMTSRSPRAERASPTSAARPALLAAVGHGWPRRRAAAPTRRERSLLSDSSPHSATLLRPRRQRARLRPGLAVDSDRKDTAQARPRTSMYAGIKEVAGMDRPRTGSLVASEEGYWQLYRQAVQSLH